MPPFLQFPSPSVQIDEGPVANIEDYKRDWEKYPRSLINPVGNFVRRHGRPT